MAFLFPCDVCKGDSLYINVGSTHWCVCERCKLKWCIGSRIFWDWEEESEFVWQRNTQILERFRPVGYDGANLAYSLTNGNEGDELPF